MVSSSRPLSSSLLYYHPQHHYILGRWVTRYIPRIFAMMIQCVVFDSKRIVLLARRRWWWAFIASARLLSFFGVQFSADAREAILRWKLRGFIYGGRFHSEVRDIWGYCEGFIVMGLYRMVYYDFFWGCNNGKWKIVVKYTMFVH